MFTFFPKMPPLRKCRPWRLAPSASLGTPLSLFRHVKLENVLIADRKLNETRHLNRTEWSQLNWIAEISPTLNGHSTLEIRTLNHWRGDTQRLHRLTFDSPAVVWSLAARSKEANVTGDPWDSTRRCESTMHCSSFYLRCIGLFTDFNENLIHVCMFMSAYVFM